jgi:hypothetical protein
MAIKHVGRFKSNGRKCVVVFRTLPNDPEHALVVQTENLGDNEHDTLMRLVESNTGQVSEELADAMQRTPLQDGSIMLANFHTNGKLTKVATKDIEMTPDTQTVINLAELNSIIAEQKGVSINDLAVNGSSVQEVGTANEMPASTVEAQAQTAQVEEQPLSDEDLAKNMRADADRMFKEAERLRKEAEELSPSKKKASSNAKA